MAQPYPPTQTWPISPDLIRKEYPTIVEVDPFVRADQQMKIHNRWHPEIPAVVTVNPGDVFKVESVDWSGGQIGNNNSCADVALIDYKAVQNLSGPIAVNGAEPGDYLVVDIVDVSYFPQVPWGYTASTYYDGEFCDGRSLESKAIWDFDGVYASSRHIGGVRFAGSTHPSAIGVAPSAELLDIWNERESNIQPDPPGKGSIDRFGPDDSTAHIGQDLPPALMEKIKKEGAKVLAGREHGGNCNIKYLSKGSRCYFPVFINGANLSIGDLHFSQGDGKLFVCGGIKMAGITTVRVDVLKNGVEKFMMKQPMFAGSPINPLYSRKLCFQGLSVDINGDGTQFYLSTTVAYKQAVQNTINYLMKLGYTVEQARLLLSAAPIQTHIAAVVDRPNICVTIELPTGIFTHDILPGLDGVDKNNYGQCVVAGP